MEHIDAHTAPEIPYGLLFIGAKLTKIDPVGTKTKGVVEIKSRTGEGGGGGRGPDLKRDTKLPYIALLYSLVRQREMVPSQ